MHIVSTLFDMSVDAAVSAVSKLQENSKPTMLCLTMVLSAFLQQDKSKPSR